MPASADALDALIADGEAAVTVASERHAVPAPASVRLLLVMLRDAR